MLLKMKQILVSILVYLSFIIQENQCNPIDAFQPHHMITHPNFMNMHPAILPLYPLQYPAVFPNFHQHQLTGASSNIEEQLQQANNQLPIISNGQTIQPITPLSKDNAAKNDEEDDDANKRDDEDTFWEAASSYGKNRWNNFKEGFTELYDVFKAAGRGFKNIFTTSD